jgi:hypothetical protein
MTVPVFFSRTVTGISHTFNLFSPTTRRRPLRAGIGNDHARLPSASLAAFDRSCSKGKRP